MRVKPDRIQKTTGYTFNDPDLLRKALTHSSHAYENQPDGPQDNELLEFLGDSVIGLVTAEFYFRAFPDRTEGELSKLKASATSTLALAKQAQRIKLDKAILLGRGEEKSGGRTKGSILAGAFEALVGALYLDGFAGHVAYAELLNDASEIKFVDESRAGEIGYFTEERKGGRGNAIILQLPVQPPAVTVPVVELFLK